MYEVFGDRKLVLARELTKKFEEFRRGTVQSILTYYETHEIKGEIVLVVEGYQETESDLITYNPYESVKEHVERLIAEGVDKKEAMKIVATERKIKKTEVYAVLIED